MARSRRMTRMCGSLLNPSPSGGGGELSSRWRLGTLTQKTQDPHPTSPRGRGVGNPSPSGGGGELSSRWRLGTLTQKTQDPHPTSPRGRGVGNPSPSGGGGELSSRWRLGTLTQKTQDPHPTSPRGRGVRRARPAWPLWGSSILAPPSKVGWAQKQNDFATQTKKLCHENGAERHFLGCLREASILAPFPWACAHGYCCQAPAGPKSRPQYQGLSRYAALFIDAGSSGQCVCGAGMISAPSLRPRPFALCPWLTA
jgi:hypothetical protein